MTEVLRLALDAWERSAFAPTGDMVVMAERLAEFDLFSKRQLEKLCGVHYSHLAGIQKTDTRGGMFSPESLPALMRAVHAEGPERGDHVREARRLGTGPAMISRLTGFPRPNVAFWLKTWREGDE